MQYFQYATWIGAVAMALMWGWFSLTRYRWKCVAISTRRTSTCDYRYRVTGVTWDGIDFQVHAHILNGLNHSPKLVVKYICAWAMWNLVEVETITDSTTNKTIYFKDLG